jgi:trk system potassium uptake protein TrkH
MGQQTVPATVVSAILGFFLFYLLLFLLFTLAMTFYLPDLQSASSAVIACMSNVGPGFNLVGPTRNFAAIGDGGIVLLTFCMLLGRLELFTVLVLFSPRFWRK